MTRADAVAEQSRVAIERGSKSFALASMLFDETTRESAHLLYAWCRHCDDVIDGQVLGENRGVVSAEDDGRRLRRLEESTRRALRGEPGQDAAFMALSRVVAKHQIPERHPLELLKGFSMDVDQHVYETIDDTLRYCYHVAGVVGVMMAYIIGVRDEATLNRASDLGIALQLTNIVRDIVEDARVGRVYLPSRWLADEGLDANDLLDRSERRALSRVARRMLSEALPYYASGRNGLSQLPLRSAWAVATAGAVYGDIGRVVMNRGPKAWDERSRVGTGRKLWLAMVGAVRAGSSRMPRSRSDGAPRHELWTMTEPELGS